jgi:hypothetical protein
MDHNDTITIDLGDVDPFSYESGDTVTLDLSGIDSAAADMVTTVNTSGIGSITISDFTLNDFDITTSEWFKDQEILKEHREEEEIRARNEGVQKAWEQYKIMVALAKEPPENLDKLE